MIYAIVVGEYEDYDIIGYFDNQTDADKYGAAYIRQPYYIQEVQNLKGEADLSNIELNYEYRIVYVFNNGRYTLDNGEYLLEQTISEHVCYISDELRVDSIEYDEYDDVLMFYINTYGDNRKLAKEKAETYLFEILKRHIDDGMTICDAVVTIKEKLKEQFKE